MLQVVVLVAALAYYSAPDVTRDPLEPSSSSQAGVAKSSVSATREFVGALLTKNHYVQRLYGNNTRSWPDNNPKWLDKLTLIYTGLLDEESQKALEERTKQTEDMCPTGCWGAGYSYPVGHPDMEAEATHSATPGANEHVGINELVNVGAEGLTWITSRPNGDGHLAVASDDSGDAVMGLARNKPIAGHAWVEALHCASLWTPAGVGDDRIAGVASEGAAWFYAVPGSGVSVNVGRTLHISEYALQKEGVGIGVGEYWRGLANEQLAMFWDSGETNLTKYLGLSFEERQQFDSVQRIDHHEIDELPAYHEIVLNPKYLKEHERMDEARHDVVKCGTGSHLHSCEQGVATDAQLTIVSNECATTNIRANYDFGLKGLASLADLDGSGAAETGVRFDPFGTPAM